MVVARPNAVKPHRADASGRHRPTPRAIAAGAVQGSHSTAPALRRRAPGRAPGWQARGHRGRGGCAAGKRRTAVTSKFTIPAVTGAGGSAAPSCDATGCHEEKLPGRLPEPSRRSVFASFPLLFQPPPLFLLMLSRSWVCVRVDVTLTGSHDSGSSVDGSRFRSGTPAGGTRGGGSHARSLRPRARPAGPG